MENFGKRLKRPEKYKYIERERLMYRKEERKKEREGSQEI